jgi:hypothetical protein
MDTLNPYESSQVARPQAGFAYTTGIGIGRGFLIVVLSGMAGAFLGLLAGGVIGSLAPDYYRAVFNSDSLNPVQVGCGLGATQGFGVGLAVGCVVLLAVAISRRRRPLEA